MRKRPRDLNLLARSVMQDLTSEKTDGAPMVKAVGRQIPGIRLTGAEQFRRRAYYLPNTYQNGVEIVHEIGLNGRGPPKAPLNLNRF